jgi:sulfur-oxidizing protein SoxY
MNQDIQNLPELDRRALLKALGLGVLSVAGTAVASQAYATPEDTAKKLSELVGGAQGSPNSASIAIDMPEIAENGATVPISVTVDSPMMADSHVKAIHILAEGNPSPEVISFRLTPSAGKASVSTRMRLGKTQNIVVAAVMSDGKVNINTKEVKVTIGGCGG